MDRKTKTSITLSPALLRLLETHAGAGASRSAYIERVLWRHFRRLERKLIDERDAALIDAAADRLNEEMADVLRYQWMPEGEVDDEEG